MEEEAGVELEEDLVRWCHQLTPPTWWRRSSGLQRHYWSPIMSLSTCWHSGCWTDRLLAQMPLEKPDSREKLERVQAKLKWYNFPGLLTLFLKGFTSAATQELTIHLLSKLITVSRHTLIDPSQLAGAPMVQYQYLFRGVSIYLFSEHISCQVFLWISCACFHIWSSTLTTPQGSVRRRLIGSPKCVLKKSQPHWPTWHTWWACTQRIVTRETAPTGSTWCAATCTTPSLKSPLTWSHT